MTAIFDKMLRINLANNYPNDCVKLFTDHKKAYKVVDFILDPSKEYLKVMQKEWLLLRSLDHPGVLKVGSWSDMGTYAYYVMDHHPLNLEQHWRLLSEGKRDMVIEGVKDVLKYLWSMGVEYGAVDVRNVRICKDMPVLACFEGSDRVRVPEKFESYLEGNLGEGGWGRFEEAVRGMKKGLF